MSPTESASDPMPRLALASKSATRVDMLRRAGFDFDVEGAGIDERAVEEPLRAAGAGPGEIAAHLAAAKAVAVSRRRPGDLVIGADQTLGLGTELCHKVDTRAEARRQIERLAGRTHELHSAVALARAGTVVWSDVAVARMTMRALTPAEIDRYLDRAGDAVLGSVGCYQIEGLGIGLFEAVDGDTFTILGLPLLPLLAELRRQGFAP